MCDISVWSHPADQVYISQLKVIIIIIIGNQPESKGREIKEISRKGKTIKTKQDFPEQRNKIQSNFGREWHENIPTTGCQRYWTILDDMATKKHNEK